MPHGYPVRPYKKEIMSDNQGNQNTQHMSRTKQLSRPVADIFESTSATNQTKNSTECRLFVPILAITSSLHERFRRAFPLGSEPHASQQKARRRLELNLSCGDLPINPYSPHD